MAAQQSRNSAKPKKQVRVRRHDSLISAGTSHVTATSEINTQGVSTVKQRKPDDGITRSVLPTNGNVTSTNGDRQSSLNTSKDASQCVTSKAANHLYRNREKLESLLPQTTEYVDGSYGIYNRRTTCRRRIDHEVYQSYLAALLQSSHRSDRFLRLRRMYDVMDRIAVLEAELEAAEATTPTKHADQMDSNGSAEQMTSSGRIYWLISELDQLYQCLEAIVDAAATDKQSFNANLITGKADKLRWNPRNDYGLIRRQSTVDQLRDQYVTAAAGDPSSSGSSRPMTSSSIGINGYSRRQVPFERLVGLFRRLDDKANRERRKRDLTRQNQQMRRRSYSQSSVASVSSQYSSIGSNAIQMDGTYIRLMELAATKARERPMYGYHMHEYQHPYDRYVQSRRLWRPRSVSGLLDDYVVTSSDDDDEKFGDGRQKMSWTIERPGKITGTNRNSHVVETAGENIETGELVSRRKRFSEQMVASDAAERRESNKSSVEIHDSEPDSKPLKASPAYALKGIKVNGRPIEQLSGYLAERDVAVSKSAGEQSDVARHGCHRADDVVLAGGSSRSIPVGSANNHEIESGTCDLYRRRRKLTGSRSRGNSNHPNETRKSQPEMESNVTNRLNSAVAFPTPDVYDKNASAAGGDASTKADVKSEYQLLPTFATRPIDNNGLRKQDLHNSYKIKSSPSVDRKSASSDQLTERERQQVFFRSVERSETELTSGDRQRSSIIILPSHDQRPSTLGFNFSTNNLPSMELNRNRQNVLSLGIVNTDLESHGNVSNRTSDRSKCRNDGSDVGAVSALPTAMTSSVVVSSRLPEAARLPVDVGSLVSVRPTYVSSASYVFKPTRVASTPVVPKRFECLPADICMERNSLEGALSDEPIIDGQPRRTLSRRRKRDPKGENGNAVAAQAEMLQSSTSKKLSAATDERIMQLQQQQFTANDGSSLFSDVCLTDEGRVVPEPSNCWLNHNAYIPSLTANQTTYRGSGESDDRSTVKTTKGNLRLSPSYNMVHEKDETDGILQLQPQEPVSESPVVDRSKHQRRGRRRKVRRQDSLLMADMMKNIETIGGEWARVSDRQSSASVSIAANQQHETASNAEDKLSDQTSADAVYVRKKKKRKQKRETEYSIVCDSEHLPPWATNPDVDNPESIPEWARIERSTGPPPSHRVSLTTSAPVNSQTIPEALLPRDTADRKSTTSDHGCDVAPAPIGHAVAVYPFRAQSSRELSFDRGEAIVLLKHLDRNWFEGQCRGLIGSFPASYVEVLSLDVTDASNKRIEGLATATYSFLAETNVELSFKKGDKVVLIRRIDSNWYEGRIGDRRGIVPVNYLSVERQPSYPMSDIAKSDRTSSTPGPTSSSGQEHSRNVNSLLNKLPTAEEKQTSSSDVIYDRQPSLSTAEMSNSGETSEKTRDVVSSYQPRGTQNSDVIVTGPNARSLPCGRSSNDARHLNVHGRSGNVNSSIANGAPYLSDKHQRLPEYRVLYNYRSRQPDELDIAVDDVIHVSDICDDGWYWGTSQRTKKFGSFPGNFVQPV